MKKILLYIFIFSILNSCSSKQEIDKTKLNNLAAKVLGSYKINDTIYFKSNLNNFDTIKIAQIDTIDNYHPLLILYNTGRERIIKVKIQYLPYKKTYEGFIQSKTGKYDSIGNQDFLTIHARVENEPVYYSRIYFQNIRSEIAFFKNIDTIKDSVKRNKNSFRIEELYWTSGIGLSGYRTSEDEIYYLLN